MEQYSIAVASATYTSIAAQVTAIQGGSGYGRLYFYRAENSEAMALHLL